MISSSPSGPPFAAATDHHRPGPSRRGRVPLAACLLGLAALLAVGASAACGKKGPPLAPLIKVPATPQDVAARRAGGVANVQLRIPVTNSDGTRPADLDRVEVYAFTGVGATPADVVKGGTLVASVPVRQPPEDEEDGAEAAPQETEPPAASTAKPEGVGQGDLVVVTEAIGPAQRVVVEPRRDKRAPASEPDPWQPSLQPEEGKGDTRFYYVLGVSRKGRRGAFAAAQPVPLIEPPGRPAAPTVEYDEKGLHLAWKAPGDLPRPIQEPPAEGMLASTPRGLRSTRGGYNVYEVGAGQPPAGTGDKVLLGSLAKPLNGQVLAEPLLDVPGVEFGKERCFVVRSVVQAGSHVVESQPTAVACATPKDTFAPAAPKGLSAVGSEGAISLIWEAVPDADLAGYLVFRGEAGGAPRPLTPEPIKETTFRDTTAARGARYVYTVVAVDAVGNRSVPSNAVEETAR